MSAWTNWRMRRSSVMCVYLVIVFIVNVMVVKVNGLKLLQVSIPPLRLTGQSARLVCLYDLEGDALYSIKWYKGGKEFYRYVQRDQPPIQVFPVDGVVVEKSQSDQYQVTLTHLTIASAGRYKCEVSVDAPSFQTSYSTVEMSIVAIPESGPQINARGHHLNYNVLSRSRGSSMAMKNDDGHRSFSSYYRPGDDDEIEINCTSVRSKPAAALEWYVDGVKVQGDHLIEYAPFEEDSSTLETSVLGLRWKLPSIGASQSGSSGSDVLVLNCTAAVSSVYWSSTALTLSPEPGHDGKSRPILMYHESHLSAQARRVLPRTEAVIFFPSLVCMIYRLFISR